MFFWSGGFILLSIVLGQAGAYLLATRLSGDPDYVDLHGWPLGFGYFVSAALCWLLDVWMNRSLDRVLPVSRATGPGHPGGWRTFALHPIRWCSVAMVVLGILLCFYHRTSAQLWRSRQEQADRLAAPSRPPRSPTAPP